MSLGYVVDAGIQGTVHVEWIVDQYDVDAIQRVTGPMKRTPLHAAADVERPGYRVSVSLDYATKKLHVYYRKAEPKDTRDPAPLLSFMRATGATEDDATGRQALAAARELRTFRDVPYAIKSWAQHYYGLLASRWEYGPPRDMFERHTRDLALSLVESERLALLKGVERWDLGRFEELLNRGSQADRELQHMGQYYGGFTTLAAYAQHLLDNEHWEDAQ